MIINNVPPPLSPPPRLPEKIKSDANNYMKNWRDIFHLDLGIGRVNNISRRSFRRKRDIGEGEEEETHGSLVIQCDFPRDSRGDISRFLRVFLAGDGRRKFFNKPLSGKSLENHFSTSLTVPY